MSSGLASRTVKLGSSRGKNKFSRVHGPVCLVGDVHGYLDKLKSLWDRISEGVGGQDVFDKLNVVFLGDYCDKGPQIRETLDWLTTLSDRHPQQNHFFLCGNHDFALSSFLGLLPEGVDENQSRRISETWRTKYESRLETEQLYTGPGHETMHLQGVRYAAEPKSIFESHPTFSSYGVPYADREALLAAMPVEHQNFFSDLRWIVELKSTIGDIIAVHAGLEEENDLKKTVEALRARSPDLLEEAFIEPFCGRANVEKMPHAMLPPVLRKRGFLPPPLFLVSGHHGFVRVNGRRIIMDMCAGRPENKLGAVVLHREGAGMSHHPLSNDEGLSLRIITSKPGI